MGHMAISQVGTLRPRKGEVACASSLGLRPVRPHAPHPLWSSFLPGLRYEDFCLGCIFSVPILGCFLKQSLAKDLEESTPSTKAISPCQGLGTPIWKTPDQGTHQQPRLSSQPLPGTPTPEGGSSCVLRHPGSLPPPVAPWPWLVGFLVSAAERKLPRFPVFQPVRNASVLIKGPMVWCSHIWPSVLCLYCGAVGGGGGRELERGLVGRWCCR